MKLKALLNLLFTLKGVATASLLCLVISLPSCDSSVTYTKSYAIKDMQWHQKKPLLFTTDSISNLKQGYDALINLRINENYKYRNIYFFVDVEMPNKQVVRDTVNGWLQDELGNWLNDIHGFGTLKTKEFVYRKNFLFPYPGVYKFYIYQAMRDEPLEDVSDLGFTLKKVAIKE